MLCPRDQTHLIMHQGEGAGACVCSRCHGVWFSRASLEACVRRTRPPASPPSAPIHARSSPVQRQLACPICKSDRLVAHIHDGIEVDTCPRCHGVWLDHGEMEHLLRLHRGPAGPGKPRAATDGGGATTSNVVGVGEAVADGAEILGTVAEAGVAVVDFFGALG
jgi:Zn-finger nucleic acid-binding protein